MIYFIHLFEKVIVATTKKFAYPNDCIYLFVCKCNAYRIYLFICKCIEFIQCSF